MKKRTILFFLLLVSKVGLAQSSKYSLQVTAGPDYYLSQYALAGPEFFDQPYSAKLTYGASVSTYYQFTAKLALGFGLSYSRKDYQLRYSYQAIDSQDPLLPIRTIVRPAYLELPLHVKYTLATAPRYAIVAGSGLTPSFLLHTTGKTTYGDGHATTRDYTRTTLNSWLLSLPLSVGVTYYLNSRIGLMAAPEFRYYFNKIDNQAFEANPMQLSLQVGTVVRF